MEWGKIILGIVGTLVAVAILDKLWPVIVAGFLMYVIARVWEDEKRRSRQKEEWERKNRTPDQEN